MEYGEREGMCISRNSVKKGDRVLLIDDLVATGGTLSSGIELVQHMGKELILYNVQSMQSAACISLNY